MKYNIILASGSPRRRELMDRIGSSYICIPSGKEEDMSGHDPKVMVEMLSAMKADDIAEKLTENTLIPDEIKDVHNASAVSDSGNNIRFDKEDIVRQLTSAENSSLIIGCDTVVAFENKILGKPKSTEEAINMIKSFAGKAHHVHTGVCILVIEHKQIVKKLNYSVSTAVNVVPMTEDEIRAYVETGEPMDKAGAYAIQGLFCPYIDSIEGDYYNIVGYPIASIYRSFKELNIDIRTGQSIH
ncbi:MAG: septum formation protein Maf [Lachnospiraceae bacterium]|nr:septum formation protein Maf [Lachnospiraceae bacterium]